MNVYPEFTVHDLLANAVDRDPDRTAIIDRGTRYRYRDLARRVNALTAALTEHGVGRGDRAGIYLEKSFEAIVAILAVSQAGAVFVNINPLLKPRQVRYILKDCGIQTLVADANRLAALEPGSVRVAFFTGDTPPPASAATSLASVPEIFQHGGDGHASRPVLETDPAAIIYTSGSTGLPKGVVLSHRNVVAGAQIVSSYLGTANDDRILSVLPFSFDYGLNQLTTALRMGATLVLQHSRMPGDLLRSLRDDEITQLAGVPPLWPLVLQSTRSLEERPLIHLRCLTNSGGRVPSRYLEELRRLLPSTRIYLMYGLTEAFRSTYLPPEELDRGPDCIGKPVPNTEIRVLDESGQECDTGAIGELVHRGPTVALGYWGKEAETRAVFRPAPLASPAFDNRERVVYSGDLVRRDAGGFLYFVGRRDGLIKSQGYRVSPEEVEDLIVSTGIVREVCAFGVSDQEIGERIVAVVVPRGSDDGVADRIRAFCLENGPSYLVPRVIFLARELPKTPSGKIDREMIKDAFATG